MIEKNNLIQNIFTCKSYKKLFKIKKKLIEHYDATTQNLIIIFINNLNYDKFIILLNIILFKINISKNYIINYITIPTIINNSVVNIILNIISNISPYIKLLINNINTINLIKKFIENISDEEFDYLVKIITLQKISYNNYNIINNKIKILLNNIKLVYNIKDINLNSLFNIILDDTLILNKNIKNKLKDLIIKFVINNKDIIYNYILYYKKYIINFILKNRFLIAQLIPEELTEHENQLFEIETLNFILILMKKGINEGIFTNILYNYIIYIIKIIQK